MKPAARHVWIREWIRKNGSADVLNSEFVSADVEATGATSEVLGFVADRCRQLGRDLSELFELRKSHRGNLDLKMGRNEWNE